MPAPETGGTARLIPRAPRFPIHTPVRYRESGKAEWVEGKTINISRSGVFFRAEEILEPKTLLEMQIQFPSELTGGSPTSVVCWGPVVRSEPPSADDSRPALAASIIQYRLTSNDVHT